MNREQVQRELKRRIDTAREKGNWRMAEIHTAALVTVTTSRDLSVSGLSRRLAAAQAPLPVDQRVLGDGLDEYRRLESEYDGGPRPGDTAEEWRAAR